MLEARRFLEAGLPLHGHKCPSMPLGLRPGAATMNMLGVERSDDKTLLELVELRDGHCARCYGDGIRMINGCTYGKRHIKQLGFGEVGLTLVDMTTARAVCAVPKTETLTQTKQAPFFQDYRMNGVTPSQVPEEAVGNRRSEAPVTIMMVLLTALLILLPAPHRAVAGGSPAVGDSATAEPLRLTLIQAVDEALGRNPGLLAIQQEAEGADKQATAAFRQHFGEIQAVAWASRYQDAQIVRPISSQLLADGFSNLPFDRDQLHYGLTFELPLFIGGKLQAEVKLARLKAEEAKVLLGGTTWQIRANVISVYTANQAIDRAILAYQEQVKALEKTHEQLEMMVASGKKPDVDLLKMVETLEQARAELAGAYADQTHARAVLAALLDRPAKQIFQLDTLPSEFPRLPGDDVNWAALLEESSTLQAARLRVGEAVSGKHIARAEFLPKLSFRGNLLGNTGPAMDGPAKTWELTFGVSMPVFTGGSRVAAYQSASARQRAAEFALQQTRRQLEADLEGSLARLTANAAELNAAQKRVDAGREAARIEEVRYDTGAGTIEDLLRARTRAAAAEAALARAEGDLLATGARINAIVEKEIVR